MNTSALYCQDAVAQRAATQMEILPWRVQQHERSADRLEQLARTAEDMQRRAAINKMQKKMSAA